MSIFKIIIYKVIKDLIGRVNWGIIVERTATRLVIAGLDKIARLATNTVTKEMVNDIKNQLSNRKLKEMDKEVGQGWD